LIEAVAEALFAVSDAIKVWLVDPDEAMYVNPVVAVKSLFTLVNVGVVEAVTATRPAFFVVVAPVLLTVEAIGEAGERVKVTPTEPVTEDKSVPLPVAVTVTVSPAILSTRK
jgi:hypothetical protein